jgi:hypothetical protein
MIPALGIFPSPHPDPMPWDTYDADRVFWTTSIVPMAGHIVIERLNCSDSTKVRVVMNGQTHVIPGCTAECPLSDFERIITSRWVTSFCATCAQGSASCVDGISFYDD